MSNKKNIPSKGPAIYAVNHPTAFIDPLALGALLQPTMHFMLRGDMFNTKLTSFFLNQINTIPIFRFRDGFSNMKNNADTMEKVYQKLNEGRNIIILAEGQTKHEKKMRPIQKGAARMAFGAYEKFGKADIQIIPVGVNYTDSHLFRSDLMIDFGPGIPMSEYVESYQENPRKGIKELTDEVAVRMRARIVHIEDGDREPTANILLDMKRKQRFDKLLPITSTDELPLQTEWNLAERVNHLPDEKFDRLKTVSEDYQELLTGLGLSEAAISRPYQYSFFNTASLLIGLLPFLVGYACNALPVWIAKYLTDRKVKKIEFHSSLRIAFGMCLWLVYFLLLAIVLTYLDWSFWMIISLPFLGYFAVIWRDLFYEWNGARAYQGLPDSTREEFDELRGELLEWIAEAK